MNVSSNLCGNLYHEAEDRWRLSPAYDLTYSNTYYGEHTTTVDGNGRNPGEKEILAIVILPVLSQELPPQPDRSSAPRKSGTHNTESVAVYIV